MNCCGTTKAFSSSAAPRVAQGFARGAGDARAPETRCGPCTAARSQRCGPSDRPRGPLGFCGQSRARVRRQRHAVRRESGRLPAASPGRAAEPRFCREGRLHRAALRRTREGTYARVGPVRQVRQVRGSSLRTMRQTNAPPNRPERAAFGAVFLGLFRLPGLQRNARNTRQVRQVRPVRPVRPAASTRRATPPETTEKCLETLILWFHGLRR
jgi:hypothetical protein